MDEDRLIQVGAGAADQSGCVALRLSDELDVERITTPRAARDGDGQALRQPLDEVLVGRVGEIHVAGVHVAGVAADLRHLDASRRVEPDDDGPEQEGQQERAPGRTR